MLQTIMSLVKKNFIWNYDLTWGWKQFFFNGYQLCRFLLIGLAVPTKREDGQPYPWQTSKPILIVIISTHNLLNHSLNRFQEINFCELNPPGWIVVQQGRKWIFLLTRCQLNIRRYYSRMKFCFIKINGIEYRLQDETNLRTWHMFKNKLGGLYYILPMKKETVSLELEWQKNYLFKDD